MPAGPSFALSTGNVYVRVKQATQRAVTATDIAAPRIRFGKISEMMTQVTGAKAIA